MSGSVSVPCDRIATAERSTTLRFFCPLGARLLTSSSCCGVSVCMFYCSKHSVGS